MLKTTVGTIPWRVRLHLQEEEGTPMDVVAKPATGPAVTALQLHILLWQRELVRRAR